MNEDIPGDGDDDVCDDCESLVRVGGGGAFGWDVARLLVAFTLPEATAAAAAALAEVLHKLDEFDVGQRNVVQFRVIVIEGKGYYFFCDHYASGLPSSGRALGHFHQDFQMKK